MKAHSSGTSSLDLSVIAITDGSGDFDYLNVAHELGAHRTLRKPFVVSDLMNTIGQELGIASARPGNKDPQQ